MVLKAGEGRCFVVAEVVCRVHGRVVIRVHLGCVMLEHVTDGHPLLFSPGVAFFGAFSQGP